MPTHLIVGPDHHGVTAYALQLARTAERVVREECFTDDPLPDGGVHVTFTDHLFGADPDEAVDTLLRRVGTRPLSVSLHDIPQPEEGEQRFARRSRAYRRLADAASLVVVNSRHEADFFAGAGNVHVIPLPVPELAGAAAYRPVAGTVGVLGFLYPGKGHEDLIEAAAGTSYRLRFLGQVSDGHERWARDLLDRAKQLGVDAQITGWLSDDELADHMSRIAVPVCAHRHFSASGSLMTWLGAGRHVLVSDADYSREMAERFDGQITLVAPGRWREALDAHQPRPPVTPPVHGWEEVAAAYAELWWPSVSVVIPHYNAHASLARTVEAVRVQDYPGDVEIIVADDGSTTPPDLEGVTVLTQEDRGFRAAAARNLGTRSATGDVLAFVDADTVIDPGYLRAVVARLWGSPRAVVVGTRTTGPQRTEPAWLTRAWENTDHLARDDDTNWRFIISAVLTCRRDFFRELGGFDATMVGYGGEDWEFGYRAYNAGAEFVHAPDARAHHPEPDWGERHPDPAAAAKEKNRESVALASRITHPSARPAGVVFERADIVVRCEQPDRWAPGVHEAVIAAWLGAGDVAVVADPVPELFAADPRVHPDQPPARVEVLLSGPVAPAQESTTALLAALRRHGRIRAPGFMASTARARALGTEAADVDGVGEAVSGPVRLERLFAGW